MEVLGISQLLLVLVDTLLLKLHEIALMLLFISSIILGSDVIEHLVSVRLTVLLRKATFVS